MTNDTKKLIEKITNTKGNVSNINDCLFALLLCNKYFFTIRKFENFNSKWWPRSARGRLGRSPADSCLPGKEQIIHG